MTVQETGFSRRRSVFRPLWIGLTLLVVFSLGLVLLELLGFDVIRHWSSGNPSGDALGLDDPAAGAVRSEQTENPARAMKRLLKWAEDGEANIEKNIHDYSAVVVKRERDGKDLSPVQVMFIKVRHHPFSVFLRMLTPDASKGQEAIYVEGQRNGNLVGHTTGWLGSLVAQWNWTRRGRSPCTDNVIRSWRWAFSI